MLPPASARPSRPSTAGDHVPIASGALILVGLSTAPAVSLNRWVTEDPWPYVYSVWGAGLFGAGLFVLHVVAPMTARPIGRAKPLLVAMAAPVALAVWALASAWWSVSPARTPLDAVLLLLVVLTAVWFGYALTFRQQVWSLFVALHLLTLLSFVSALLFESARYPRDGSWMGVFNNPNTTGPVATLGVVAAIGAMLLTGDRSLRIVIGLCIVLDVIVAIGALSVTGLVALCAAIAAFVVTQVVTRRGPRRQVRAVGTALVVAAVVSVPWSIEIAADVVGRGSTLSGRTLIWDFVRESVAERWLHGFGWSSFWDDPANRAPFLERIARVRPEWTDDLATLSSAHSSFMETLLFLGVVGLALLLVLVAFSLGRTWWEALGRPSAAMAWWAAVGTFALFENATESMIAFNQLFWVLLVAPGFAATRYAETVASDARTSAVPSRT